MAELLTIQDSIDGRLDVKSLGEAANGDENTQVVTRTGETYPSAAKTMKILLEQGTLDATVFGTKSLMLLSSLANNSYALVTDDTTSANNGYYQKRSGSWVYLAYNYTSKMQLLQDRLLTLSRYEIYDSYDDFSDVVDPDFDYIYQLYASYFDGIDDNTVMLNNNQIYVDYNHVNKSLAVIWRHTNEIMFKTIWQPNGANSLFNFKSISSAIGADPTTQSWTLIQTVDTDYIPPVAFLATTGAMTSTGVSTAGGNHTTSDGTRTANMTAISFYVDGSPLLSDYKGLSESVKCVWTNMIYAPNTVVEQRYTLKQEVLAEFTAGHVGVLCKYTALEPLNLIYEGGSQLVGDGWIDGASFYNGVIKGFQPKGGFLSAGTKSEAPNSWAVVLKSSTLGYMASYLDRGFGTGSSKVASDGVMAATNTNGAWKFYNFTARNSTANQQSLAANEVMTWRGGYAYAPLNITDLNSAFIAKVGGKKAIGYEALANQKGVIKLPSDMLGKDYQLLTTSPSGAYVSATTYQSNLSKEV